MRVLHLVHQYPPDFIGGTEHYTHTVAQQLAAMGHDIAVVTRVSRPGQGVERSQEDGVAVYRVWQGTPSAQQRYLATFNTATLVTLFETVIAEFAPDVVHVQHLMGLPAALLLRLRQRKIPYVITLHDYWWVCANAQLLTNYSQEVCDGPRGYVNCTRCAVARGGNSAWLAAPALWGSLQLRGSILHKGLTEARGLVASTPFVAEWYAQHGASAVQVLPLGIDLPPYFAKDLVNAPSPGARLQVAYLGGLAWQKGVHVVVEACRTLGESVDLWVVGSGEDEYVAQLRQHAAPHLHFLGALDRDAVWALLARSDVVVVPSLWYETYSYVLHEARAAGVPVIASNLGVMAEAVTDGVDGLLVPPGDVAAWHDALQRLAADRALLARLAPQDAPRLTVREHVQELVKIYQRVW